jgi:hypothetical protein
MGKTILDLFETKRLSGQSGKFAIGKTAETAFTPRDSKDIQIQTNSPIINNTSVPSINRIRGSFGIRLKETALEQEGLGIRPLYTLSTPVLYGTDVLRLETQRTDQTEGMKNSANGGGGTDGILGGGIQKLKKATTSGLEKLGVKFPSDLNPTNYVENLEKIKNKSETPFELAKIKGSGEGNVLGKAIAQSGTPEQIVKNAAGAAVSSIKQKVRGAIFGERSTTGFADSDTSLARGTTINYGSSDDANPKPTVQITDVAPNSLRVIVAKDANGRRYSKTFNLPQKVDDSIIQLGGNGLDSNGNFVESTSYTENAEGFNGLAEKYRRGIVRSDSVRNPGVGQSTSYSKLTKLNKKGQTDNINEQSLEARRGMKNGSDIINQSGVYATGNTSGGEAVDVGGPKARLGWYYDFVPLKINRLNDNKTVYFRSTISGLSETFSPSWDSAKFIGNPFNYYTYSGIERSVSFNLKVYALNGREMVSMWDKLEFLSSLTYPAAYQSSTSYIIPPFIKFTLGSMYDRKEGFIESLTYTIDESTPWEIGLTGRGTLPVESTPLTNYRNDFSTVKNETPINGRPTPTSIDSLDNYRLPMIVDVQMNVKFVESRNNTKDKLYAFGQPVTNG